jgi:CheY-like chemotaxis protein
MEAIGTLASGIAHDFNNLLMGVSGCTAIALDRLCADSPARPFLEEIQRSIDGGAAITKQLLTFSHRDVPTIMPEPRELDRSIADTEQMLRRLLGEDIEVAVELRAPGLAVRLDSGQIHQVLLNLALNARDAMPRGGKLEIQTRALIVGGERTGSANLPPGDHVVLRVLDSGIGMSPEVRAHALEPFFTTKPAGRGTGLGLSTVYGIVKSVDGRLSIESRPNAGTVVEILLPATRCDVVRADPRRDAEVDQRPGAKVLVLEDDPAVRRTVRHYLERSGYHVLEATTGPQALALLRTEQRPIDLLLTDMVLPEMGGDEVVMEARRLRPNIATLFMSAHSAAWLRDTGRIDSGVETLQKPFDGDQLVRSVRRALQPRPPERPLGSILIVEDNGTARLALSHHLETEGWRVTVAGSKAEALDRLRAGDAVDVLLVDYGLPDGKGDALAREARAQLPQLPIVYMSGYPRLAPDPPGPILEKPFGLDAMAALVRSVLPGAQ